MMFLASFWSDCSSSSNTICGVVLCCAYIQMCIFDAWRHITVMENLLALWDRTMQLCPDPAMSLPLGSVDADSDVTALLWRAARHDPARAAQMFVAGR